MNLVSESALGVLSISFAFAHSVYRRDRAPALVRARCPCVKNACTKIISATISTAGQMVAAFEGHGAVCFLTPANETQNAVLWCLFDERPSLVRKPFKTTMLQTYAKQRAARRARQCGVQFDAEIELRRTVFVSSDTVIARLADLV